MSKIESHRDFIVWQKAHGPVGRGLFSDKAISARRDLSFDCTNYSLVVSVPANIAEGHSRSTKKDYANFLAIAKGSLVETETFLMLALRLGYLDDQQTGTRDGLVPGEVSKMIATIRVKLINQENHL